MLAVNHVLVVCVGNICRSPLAEHLLRQGLPDLSIRSAGVDAVIGADMDAMARDVARARGHQLAPHTARQLKPQLCQEADLILVMETCHREAVGLIHPPARGKTLLLGQGLTPDQIPDPYRKPEAVHQAAQAQIEAACARWIARLSR